MFTESLEFLKRNNPKLPAFSSHSKLIFMMMIVKILNFLQFFQEVSSLNIDY